MLNRSDEISTSARSTFRCSMNSNQQNLGKRNQDSGFLGQASWRCLPHANLQMRMSKGATFAHVGRASMAVTVPAKSSGLQLPITIQWFSASLSISTQLQTCPAK
ncbi:hypothetical protein PoB_002988200 [Plakobranchus ocellatus]|uniref:Uncharacterized protein n=1 Tax=Plakobranchus ocellatus TaxID=259542 RepID=A0AAV4A8V2_9GAST|nr:hypothetical protein PoB_002988200 [Plakobranchus ocellatus]